MNQVETTEAKDIAKPNRLLAIALCVALLAVGLGLETQPLPSVFRPSSVNYGKDTQLELRFYGNRIGTFGRTPNFQTRYASEDNLVIEYSGGPYVTNIRTYFETTGLGFLAPLFAYKAGLVLAVLAACAVLLALSKRRFADAATSVAIRLYAAGLLATGIAGTFLTPPRISLEISRTGFAWLVMAPLYALMWLTFLFAIAAGIAVLRRRKRAAWWAIVAQVLLAYGVVFLVRTIVEPLKPDLPGYRLRHMDWSWYGGAYALLVLVVAWFLTRPRTRAWLGSSP